MIQTRLPVTITTTSSNNRDDDMMQNERNDIMDDGYVLACVPVSPGTTSGGTERSGNRLHFSFGIGDEMWCCDVESTNREDDLEEKKEGVSSSSSYASYVEWYVTKVTRFGMNV